MGGVVGGLVGGILGGGGGLLGGIVSNLTGGIVNDLVDRFGLTDIAQAVTNLAGDLLQAGLNSIIDSLPIPDFMKDLAKNLVADVIGGEQGEVPGDAQQAVNEELGGTVSDIVNAVLDNIRESMQEESEETGNGQGGSGNWLMVLAKALGEASGKHLKNMVELGEKMGAMDSEENPEAFAETQAEFQAASQIFKMFQESISTMIKSIGEGMSTVARKQ